MKVLIILLVLITTCPHLEVGAVTVRIRAYNATGELDIRNTAIQRRDDFILGTRALLTCHVTGLHENHEVVSYRWFHNCTGGPQGRCQILDRDPYYRVVSDALLVDVTSWNQGRRYYCFVKFNMLPLSSSSTPIITVAGNPVPFLYTPTSILPEHSVLTDVQQATGRNGQQWITCRSGGLGPRPNIWMGSNEVVPSNSTANSVTIGLGTQHPNGLYHCWSEQSQRQYFSLFLMNSVTLPTPTVSSQDTSMWTIASPDGSRVERYIVEFECSVQNITFVEKYMSVSASRGTGRVATNASCFGGLGQLYRVKVWAVSGPSISRALVCIPDGQCREEGWGAPVRGVLINQPYLTGGVIIDYFPLLGCKLILQTNTDNPVMFTPTTVGSRGTPTNPTTVTAPPGNTDRLPPTPSGPQGSSMDNATTKHDGEQSTIGTAIGVGVGVSMFLLLVMLITVVLLILVVVVVMRKAAYKQKRDTPMGDNLHYSNTVVVEQEMELKEKGVGADYKDADGYEDIDNGKGEDDGPNADGFDPYEVVDRKLHVKDVKKVTPKESAPTSSTANVPHIYAVVDKSKKKGAKKFTEDGCTVANNDHYAMPMKKKMGEISDKGEGMVESVGVEEREQYDDTVGFTYEPKADSKIWHTSEGGSKC